MTLKKMTEAYASSSFFMLDAAWEADRKGYPGSAAALLFEAKRCQKVAEALKALDA
jgi:hypothetical protein